MSGQNPDELSHEQLMQIIRRQAAFITTLRHAVSIALAHYSYVVQHYAINIPDDLLRDMTRASMQAQEVLTAPTPTDIPVTH